MSGRTLIFYFWSLKKTSHLLPICMPAVGFFVCWGLTRFLAFGFVVWFIYFSHENYSCWLLQWPYHSSDKCGHYDAVASRKKQNSLGNNQSAVVIMNGHTFPFDSVMINQMWIWPCSDHNHNVDPFVNFSYISDSLLLMQRPPLTPNISLVIVNGMCSLG